MMTRYEKNPILTASQVPYPADLVFNAGVTKYNGNYIMIFRNDYGYDGSRFAGTNLGIAFSDNGVQWEVRPEPFFTPEQLGDPEILRIYDPRLTVLENRLYLCFDLSIVLA